MIYVQHNCKVSSSYVYMLYESLVGQCEYTTQPKGSFWCHVIDTKGAILLVILLNKFVLVLFHYNLGIYVVELKLLQNLKSETGWA